MQFKVNDIVLVRNNHWARPYARGLVEEVLEKGRYLILFEQPGIGFDGGLHLALDSNDLELADA